MTSSKILFLIGISFIGGVFLSSIFAIPQIIIWAFLLIGILLIIFSFYKKIFIILGFCLLIFCLGILRYQISIFNIENNDLIQLNDKQDEITLNGTVVKEPDNRDKVQRLKVKVDNFGGLVLITKNRYPEYNYLDKIEITGKLKTPADFGDFNYKNYLLKDGVYSVMDFPKTELISRFASSSFGQLGFEKVLFVKQKLRESIRQIYLPPESLVIEGTILGDSSALTQELKDQLNITGLRHIIAVSGTHIIILSSILMYLFLFLGFWRGQAFYGSIAFIWLYILLTGLPASGIRAGIMATLFLFAQKIGRNAGGERIIVMSCALMLLINPLLLFYDIGFQLSFLAVLGLIYLQKPINEFLKFIVSFIKNKINKAKKPQKENEKLDSIFNMVSATLSAQIFTIPIMLYNFGNISFIAPITNILVLPIVEYLMIFGFLSSIIGIFSEFLGFIISIPSYFLIIYFLKILEIFSQAWAMKVFENVHWIWLIILYLIIIIFVAWVKKKERENRFY